MQAPNTKSAEIKEEFFKGISKHRAAIMGLSIISVMLFHQYFISIPPFNIFHNYGYWGVDMFLFLSGMGMVSSLKNHTLAEFCKRRLLRILPICVVCGTLKYTAFLSIEPSVASIQKGLHLGWWSVASLDLWYVYVILIFYAASPLLYESLKRFPKKTLFPIIILFCLSGLTLRPKVGYEWMSPTGLFAWTMERLPVFVIGMTTGMRKELINKKNITLSALFLLNAIFVVIIKKGLGISVMGECVIRMLSVALGMLSLTYICIQLLNRMPNTVCNFLRFIGRHSFEIYLIHEFIFTVFMVLYSKQSNPYALLATSLSLSVFIACLCNIVAETLKRCIETKITSSP